MPSPNLLLMPVSLGAPIFSSPGNKVQRIGGLQLYFKETQI